MMFAKNLCRNIDDSEDITQETFVRAYSSFHTYNREGAIENWLMRIAYNVFLDLRRHRDRRIKAVPESDLGLDFEIESVVDTQSSGGTESRLNDSLQLQQAMIQLSPEEQTLIRYAFFEQMTCREIGVLLGMSTMAVQNRLGRARRKLHQVMVLELQLSRVAAAA